MDFLANEFSESSSCADTVSYWKFCSYSSTFQQKIAESAEADSLFG